MCGANGTIGSRVITELLKANAAVRALVRERKENVPSEGNVKQVAGDLAHPETLAKALNGTTEVFLLSPNGSKQAEMEGNVISAAVANGVRRIVKLSMMGASRQSPATFARIHGEVEDAIRSSGLAWTFIRPNMLMQNLRWYKKAMAQGVLPLPLGEAAVSHVDAEDVAAITAEVLLGQTHDFKTYTVTGPEALTGEQAASTLSASLGRAIVYQPVPIAEFRSFLQASGDSEFVIDAECELLQHWSRGMGAAVSSDVEQVLGRKPVDLESFSRQHAAEFS